MDAASDKTKGATTSRRSIARINFDKRLQIGKVAKSAAASSMRMRRQEEHIARINQQQIKSSPEAPLTVQVSLNIARIANAVQCHN